MDIPDKNVYEFEEAAELAKKAVKRLNVTKIAVEYLFARDEFDRDEMRYCEIFEQNWQNFTTEQKQILFLHIVQGISFTSIGKLNGYTQQNASKIFAKACGIIQNNI
jgi:hypothetical protein